jgi:microsomal dipeptidase-like Zn-dependent dipeptidase
MSKFIKVKDHPHLYRDEKTGAIVNCDTVAYNNYVKKLERKDNERKELDEMKKDIEEIKSLLKEFLNK